MAKIDTMLLLMQDAEIGQRGYVITGDNSYLEPFVAAEAKVTSDLDDLQKPISDNPTQIARLAQVRGLIRDKLAELKATIEKRRDEGFDASRASIMSNKGKETMDRIRAINAEMGAQEQALLAQRLANARLIEGLIVLVAVIGVSLSLAGRFVAALVRARLRS